MAKSKGPLTDAEKATIRQLHADGMTRNGICEATGRSAGAISGFCKDEGLIFGNTAETETAVKVRSDRMRAKRSEIADDLLADVLKLKSNILRADDGTDAKGWAIAMGICIDKHLALVRYDADPGTDGARAMLTQLAEALGTAAQALNGPPAGDAE